jgi:ABC-type proline/glycine betaine transport system permease subunit
VIYTAIRTLDIARSINAAIAIVVLTLILDRLAQSGTRQETGHDPHRAEPFPGAYLAPVFDWLNANLHGLFVAISHFVETVLGAIEAALLLPPAWALIAVVCGLTAGFISLRNALLAGVLLGFAGAVASGPRRCRPSPWCRWRC